MAEASPPSSDHRIDQALARIETAAKALAADRDALAQRNETLRQSLAGAIATLDSIIEERKFA
jgi:hypothetical protein